MATTPIKNVASDVPSPIEESSLLPAISIEHAPKTSASTLSNTFKKDTAIKIEEIKQTAPKKTAPAQLSLWRRLANFLTGQPVETSNAIEGIEGKSKADGIGMSGDKLSNNIDRVPVLDQPDLPTKEIKDVLEGRSRFEFFPQKEAVNEKGMAIEKLMVAIFKLRIKMSEEAAATASANMEKYDRIKEHSREFIQKLAEDIQKDEKWARFFGKAQLVTAYAGFACALVPMATAASPALAATWLATTFNPTTGAALAAVSSSMFTGGKAIYTSNKNRRSAEKLSHDLEQERFSDLVASLSTRMVDALEAASKFQGQLVDLQSTKHRVAQYVVRSS